MAISRQLAVALWFLVATAVVAPALLASLATAANVSTKVSLVARQPSFLDSVWKHMQSAACRLHRFGSTAGYAYNRLWKSRTHSSGTPDDVASAYIGLIARTNGSEGIMAEQPRLAADASLDSRVSTLATLPLLYRYAFYSAATYCDDGATVEKLTQVKLQEGGTPLPLTGAQIVHWYDEDSMGHYVAVNPAQRAVVLTFRGSNNNRNFMDAADVYEIKPNATLYDAPPGSSLALPPRDAKARVFRGFSRSAERQIETAIRQLHDAHEKHGNYSVVIAGHSLGGAVAQLAALYARIHYRDRLPLDAVYTYGKPIVGNALFEDWSVNVIGPTPFLRFVSSNDVVPHLWYDNNARNNPESRIRQAEGATEIYCPDYDAPNMIVCNGETDPRCSEMQDCTKLTWEHHSEYAGFRATKSVCLLTAFQQS
ncbi:Alpha/Beta hydrolase protein [Syncephalis pseudoplumigaleata]|uniref:Alpha/Beta hydrolase protein n=1 Tax=Syncephalis pseudoplumigaleata TaxID=1712513 RepID=A0A4P9Z3V6_9FUNG|nr:Alpha/Beta hydrolase protein [Syncephalis pseudoplumigaleata]|eukprot:RKP26220.1 Alpha/Beta hydrolase protein [Syncephalis pseudoplumigaleata]